MISASMFENIASIGIFQSIAYIVLGFATAFLSLEVAWHFTACKVHDKLIVESIRLIVESNRN
jgi:hypothetical protein